MHGLANRLYRGLLTLYPRAYRRRVGADMRDCFADLVDEARARGGRMAVLGLTARTILEMPGSLLSAYRGNGRPGKGGGGMDGAWQDLTYAWRGLLRQPGFTALAVLSLGLGVGANTAVYSMVRATLWSPLPVPVADRLVRVKEVRESTTDVSYGNYADIAREVDVFDGALMHGLESFALVSDEVSMLAHGEVVTANYFDVLGIEPQVGRFFTEAEHEAPRSPPVAVLSDFLWRRSFGADPSVVGSTVQLNGHTVTVLGIAPESFEGTKFGLGMDLWVPVRQWRALEGWTEGWEQWRTSRSLLMLARLAPDATRESADAALETMAVRLAELDPEANTGLGLRTVPEVAGQITAEQTSLPNVIGLLAVLGSGLVLLVACGNVASLLLARAVARRQEIGVRVALGAGRGRLVRQLLTESALLASLGAMVGAGLAWAASRLDSHLLPQIPYRFSIDSTPDGRTIAFAAAVSLAAVLVFGLLPALQASKPGIAGVLRGDDNAGGLRAGGSKLLNGVVVGVVSLSFVTLFLAGLFGASLRHVQSVDPGFTTEGRVIATVDFGLSGYGPEEALQVRGQVLEAARAVPGVGDVSLASSVPLGDFSSSSQVFADDREYAQGANGERAWTTSVEPDWFEVSEIRLLAGRAFTPADDAESPPVAIVNEALARTFWPDADPVGRRIRYGREPGGLTMEVVGIVETGRYMTMVEPPSPALFRPLRQGLHTRTVLVAATAGDPASLVPALRDAVATVDPTLVLFDVKTIDQHWRNAFWLYRIGAELALGVGLMASLLAAGGLYGIMVFRVGQRRREMGIRVALGAGRGRVLRHVMRGSLVLVAWGLAVGAAIALAGSGVIRNLVFGVEATSPVHLAAVAVVMTGLAVLATLPPALGATRADPVEAIRTE